MESEVENHSPQKLVDYLYELYSYAILLGMTYEEYWEYDPYLINAYVRADELRQKRKDQELWLQGLYVYHAVGNLAPVLNGFSKNPKPKKYPEFPFSTSQEAIEQSKADKFKQQLLKMSKEKIYG